MNDGSGALLSFRLLESFRSVAERLESALEPLDLSLAKFGVLSELVEAGEPLPLSGLAERCACVRSNITQLVDRLEADRLVARADDRQDRRSVRAELTPEGRERHAAAVKALQAAERGILSRLSREQRGSLIELLGRLKGGE